MEHLNRRLAMAALIAVIAIAAFVVLLNVFPPNDGGIGTMLKRPG